MTPVGVPCGSNPDHPETDPKPGAGASASGQLEDADPACRSIVEHVGSTAEEVRRTLLRVVAELSRQGVCPSDCQAIEVVLAECMNNVVEHAYAETAEGKFELRLRLSGDRLHCRVEDVGRPMPDLSLPDGVLQEISNRLEDLPEGGFGWFLIRELANDLNYSREKGRNRLSFEIGLNRNRSPRGGSTAE